MNSSHLAALNRNYLSATARAGETHLDYGCGDVERLQFLRNDCDSEALLQADRRLNTNIDS